MLSALSKILGQDAVVLHRYLRITVVYAVLCGFSVACVVPVLANLLELRHHQALVWLLVLSIVALLCWALRLRVEQAGVRVGVAILQSGRRQLGHHVAALPVAWFSAANTARLSHVMTQGMMSVAQLPAHVGTPVMVALFTPCVLVVVLWMLHWTLGVVALVILPCMAVVIGLTARLSRQTDARVQQRFVQTSQRVVEFAQAQSVLRAFNGHGKGVSFLEQALQQQGQEGQRLLWLASATAVLNTWFVQVVLAGLLWLLWHGAHHWTTDTAPLNSMTLLVVALVVVNRYVDCLLELAAYGEVLRTAQAQLQAVTEILNVQPLPEPAVGEAPHSAAVALRDVHFRYSEQGPDVLRGLTLNVPHGTMVALVGESGSGKSTILRLIARFFDVQQGRVCIGGVDVRNISSEQRVKLISQIFQDSYLFQGSIAQNIRLGKPDASQAEVLAAAHQAGVMEIIARLPQGLEAQVGEGGVLLSGGEQQRIAIARALIRKSPILLVDEATAALDTENQALISTTLALLRGQCTVLVIAHQLQTIQMADQVVVIDAGQVVEQGTPEQLLKAQGQGQGRYAALLAHRPTAHEWRVEPTKSQQEPG